MNENLSLMNLFRDDPDFAARLEKQVIEIKKDKQNLLKTANSYSERFKEEVQEGTRLRSKLLAEGSSRGLTEEEIFKNNSRFMPTVQTPILNLLYFLLREVDEDRKDIVKLTAEYNKKYGHLTHDDDSENPNPQNFKASPEMVTYLYGNITLDVFIKIKKLKALSKSPNKEEAFLAYTKCCELCEKYNLEFDRIPCYVN